MSERLTQRLVDSLRPEKLDRIVFDKTIPGFGVRVFRSGRKSFLIQYRVQKKTRRFTLGNCNLLTPYEARNKAAKLLAGVRDGKDPAQTRLEALKAPTVADLAERYLCEYAAEKKSFTEMRRNLTRYVLPVLGRHRVHAVTKGDIDRLHAEIGRRAPVQANRVLAVLSSMFGCAERWGMRPEGTNPCRGRKRFREVPRDRYLSESELVRVGSVIREVEGEGRHGPGMIAAIRLLFFTVPCRTSLSVKPKLPR